MTYISAISTQRSPKTDTQMVSSRLRNRYSSSTRSVFTKYPGMLLIVLDIVSKVSIYRNNENRYRYILPNVSIYRIRYSSTRIVYIIDIVSNAFRPPSSGIHNFYSSKLTDIYWTTVFDISNTEIVPASIWFFVHRYRIILNSILVRYPSLLL